MDLREVERIVLELMEEHGCHTAILYGSWARGTASATSDIDVLCVRASDSGVRVARFIGETYLDAFVYSESELVEANAALVRVLGGVVIAEREGYGRELLAKIQRFYDAGPSVMAEDERRAVLLWPRKMLERIANQPGPEANYRRIQLLFQMVEDYFTLRGAWFLGPRHALAWLGEHDRATYELLELAIRPDASYASLVDAVDVVYGTFK